MPLSDLLASKAVVSALKASDKKEAIQGLAARLGTLIRRDANEIFEVLLQRERLGSTGIGGGVAIPHGKLPKLDKLVGVFARLAKPINFDALDGEPVDLVFALLAPEAAGADHLKALARIARLLRDPEVAEKLRTVVDSDQMFAVLTAPAAAA
ncbi:MAG TPA: PTS IIA-like nitrogen regulatory protein PtsN [Xanthobacteraceae bacterium]|nr:PTS IIA-like nitrogen regulatory protein PtsN [Xanthobacteraceae bacterium]